MHPRKMTKNMNDLKVWLTGDLAIFINSVFAWAAANISELITALPIFISLTIQIVIRLRRAIQAERHRDELHKEAIKLLREGKITPDKAIIPENNTDN